MERSHRNQQRHHREDALTNFASIAMQSNPRQPEHISSSHQPYHAEGATPAHIHSQPQSQYGRERPNDMASGRSALTQPPHTYEPSDPHYNFSPNQTARNAEMDIMNWGRSAMPYMESVYTHAPGPTQPATVNANLPSPMNVLSAQVYHPGLSDRTHSSSAGYQSQPKRSETPNIASRAEKQAMQSFGLVKVNDNETSSSATRQKRNTTEAQDDGKGKKKRQKVDTQTLSDDDEARRSRGRPRLDPKDETAADVSTHLDAIHM